MNIARKIYNPIKVFTKKYPIIALTGPRQSGKTTLLKEAFSDYRYVSLENPDERDFAETDPNGFLRQYDKYVIIDEIQRTPSLFSYLQTIVDEQKLMGQFVISGSQNFHLMHNITQSLAGRVALFKLFPFDFQEMQSADLLHNDYVCAMVKGFYPAIYDRDIPIKSYYSNYIQTYIERDANELIDFKDLNAFRRFLRLCATRAGQILNLNSLANDCDISQPTAKAWLSALERSYIIFLHYPYHKNFSKRVIKSPKLYFYDTGLLLHLLRITDIEKLRKHQVKGNAFENMIISEYIKRMYHTNMLHDIWFWRDSVGHEVDLLIDDGDQLMIAEIKAGLTITSDAFKWLEWFERISKMEHLKKILVYGGNKAQLRSSAKLVPWKDFGRNLA